MSFLGTLIGGGAGFLLGGPAGALAGAGIGAGYDTNAANAASAQSAQDFGADQYASRWQTTVKNMQAAGLNPMLAYSQGVGNSPSGVTYQASNPFTNAAQTYSSASSIQPQVDLMDAQASASRASAWQSQAQTEFINKQASEVVQRLERDLPGKEADRLIAAAEQLRSQAALNGSLDLSQQSQRLLNVQIAKKMFAETDLLNMDVKAAQDLGNAGREFGQLKPFLDLVVNVFRVMKGH